MHSPDFGNKVSIDKNKRKTDKPKSVIRISLCRTAKRNPNDRFGFIGKLTHFLLRL